MIKILAEVELYQGEGKRKTPFTSGYRPQFEFVKESRTSGEISLINMTEFSPGDKGIVHVRFISDKYLGDDFAIGSDFEFFESEEPLGRGIVTEIMT